MFGVAVDIGGTFAGVFAIAFMHASAAPSAEAFERATSSPAVLGAFMAVGVFFSFVGGYAAAAVAARDHVRHALSVGIVGTVLGFLSAFVPSEPPAPLAYKIVPVLLTIPAAYFGGLLRSKRPEPAPPPMGRLGPRGRSGRQAGGSGRSTAAEP